MNRTLRFIAALSIIIGLPAIGVEVSATNAFAWPPNATTQWVTVSCVNGNNVLTTHIQNNEPQGSGDITVNVYDQQSHQSGVQRDVLITGLPPGQSKPATTLININTLQPVITGGLVQISRHYVDGHAGDDKVTADYPAHDCTPPPAKLAGTTSGSAACNSTTGIWTIRYSSRNTGEIGWSVTSSTLNNVVVQGPTLPGGSTPTQTFTAPGTVKLSSYTVNVTANDGRKLPIPGQLSPAAAGNCTKVVVPHEGPPPKPQPTLGPATNLTKVTTPAPTATTSTSTATMLPFTGSPIVPEIVAGIVVLIAGCIIVHKTKLKPTPIERIN